MNSDESLLEMKKDRKFSTQQLKYWFTELKKACPTVEDGLLLQTLDAYSTHPHIFDEIVDDCKKNPKKYEPKKQETLRFPEGFTNA